MKCITYILTYKWSDDPTEHDEEHENLHEAILKAEHIEEEGGWATIISSDGNLTY